jgi:hypothetical protein
VVVTEAEAAL